MQVSRVNLNCNYNYKTDQKVVFKGKLEREIFKTTVESELKEAVEASLKQGNQTIIKYFKDALAVLRTHFADSGFTISPITPPTPHQGNSRKPIEMFEFINPADGIKSEKIEIGLYETQRGPQLKYTESQIYEGISAPKDGEKIGNEIIYEYSINDSSIPNSHHLLYKYFGSIIQDPIKNVHAGIQGVLDLNEKRFVDNIFQIWS